MKALILAAGLGSRLKENTKNIPKALVEVNGIPIIEYQINALQKNNINDFIVVIGKFGEKIVEYFEESHPKIHVNFIKNEIYDKSNSSYSFWLTKDYLYQVDYIHLNCDIIFSADLLNKIISSEKLNIIAIRTDLKFTNQMENVIYNNKNRIIKMGKDFFSISKGKAFGLAKFNYQSTQKIISKIDSYLTKGDKNQHCYGMIRELVNDIKYYAFNSDDFFLHEINTESDLSKANLLLAK